MKNDVDSEVSKMKGYFWKNLNVVALFFEL